MLCITVNQTQNRCERVNTKELTHGSFMRMNTRAMKKLSSTLTKPMKSSRKRLSLGMFGALERSRMMKPMPPMVKRKLEARPSMMYCPLTLHQRQSTHTRDTRITSAKRCQVCGLEHLIGSLVEVNVSGRVRAAAYRYARKATGRWCPCSSVIEPTLGGSTMTS